MKHLKHYKIFEATQTKTHIEIFDILQELFDEFGYQIPDHVREQPSFHSLSAYSPRFGRIELENHYYFDASCIRIRLTAPLSNKNVIRPGVFKNFDGVVHKDFSELLQECHYRIIDYLNPVDTIVGSLGVSTIDLDMLYFFEKPNFKRYKDVEIYGSNIGLHLDTLGLDLISNSRHDNIIDVYSQTQNILDMVCISGYNGCKCHHFYITNEDMMFLGHRKDTPLQNWIVSEWEKVCARLKIKDNQKINADNPKIIAAQFMAILAKNQYNFKHKA